MNEEISPAEKLRQHLLFVHQYVLASLLVIEAEEGKPFIFEKLISRYELNAFVQRTGNHNVKDFTINLRDILRAYACYDCMNKLLVSKYDETIIAPLLQKELPLENPLHDFVFFRNQMLRLNMFLMKDTEQNFGSRSELKKLKKQLQDIMI